MPVFFNACFSPLTLKLVCFNWLLVRWYRTRWSHWMSELNVLMTSTVKRLLCVFLDVGFPCMMFFRVSQSIVRCVWRHEASPAWCYLLVWAVQSWRGGVGAVCPMLRRPASREKPQWETSPHEDPVPRPLPAEALPPSQGQSSPWKSTDCELIR